MMKVLLGAVVLACANATALRRLADTEATCTGRTPEETAICEEQFIQNKGLGRGYRTDCVGPQGSDTVACIYEPAQVVDQCGLLAYERSGATPADKCQAVTGCKYTDDGDCVRDHEKHLSGMCSGNSYAEDNYQCPGLYVLRPQSEAIQKPTSESDFSSACCQHDMERLFGALDGNQDGQLALAEAQGEYAMSVWNQNDIAKLVNVWNANDVNLDGNLNIDEFEAAYTTAMDVTSTPATLWLQAHCPEEMDACKADGSWMQIFPGKSLQASVKDALPQIKNAADARLVDLRECVLDRATVDCIGEWSPCSASCKKTYTVLREQDEYGFGDQCQHEDGETGNCPADETTGCHVVEEESIYSVYEAGVDFFDVIDPPEWPDCKKGLKQQKFTYWQDITPSQCLFDDGGCCEDGDVCRHDGVAVVPGDVIYKPCPKPCRGQWSPCNPDLGQRQQLEYTIVEEAEEGGAPCEYEDGSLHMVRSCPSDCVGVCQCDPETEVYKLFTVSARSPYGDSEACPVDGRVTEQETCTPCIGRWYTASGNLATGECEPGMGAYQIETYRIETEAVHGSPCPHADGETRRIECGQDCEGYWRSSCQSSSERIASLHALATSCGNPRCDNPPCGDLDHAAIAANSEQDLPTWWPYPTSDTWTAERGHHIAVGSDADNDGPNVGTIPTIVACEKMFAHLVGDKILDDESQGDSGPPCGFFFSIDPIPDEFTCPAACKAAVDQLVLHCDVYGLSEAHEGRACLHCDEEEGRPQDVEGQFGGSQAVAVFTKYDSDASGQLSADEVAKLCEKTTTENTAVIMYCGVPPDGSDTFSSVAISGVLEDMAGGTTGEASIEQFADWWGRTDEFRWNPCPFQQHCSGTHYKVFIHNQTQFGEGQCCKERHGSVMPHDCPAVDCEGDWQSLPSIASASSDEAIAKTTGRKNGCLRQKQELCGQCVAPADWATSETEALVTEQCAPSQRADVQCSYSDLPQGGSVQLMFYQHTKKAEQCGTSCMFSEGEHKPIRCKFKCDPVQKWEPLDGCTQTYIPTYVEIDPDDDGDLECPLADQPGCVAGGYEWNETEQRCESDTCGKCPPGAQYECPDEHGEICCSATPCRTGGGEGPEPLPISGPVPEPDVCKCIEPDPVPEPTPVVIFQDPPEPNPPPPPPPIDIDSPPPPPECREQEIEKAEREDPSRFDPCNEPVTEPVVEVAIAQVDEHGYVDHLYSESSRVPDPDIERCLVTNEEPPKHECLPKPPEEPEPVPEPEPTPEPEPSFVPPPAPKVFPMCPEPPPEPLPEPSCEPVDCEGCWKTPCCSDSCIEHEVYTYSQEAACGGAQCEFREGLTRPYVCPSDKCQGHWEGDCDDPDVKFQEWVVDSGCGCIEAHCVDELSAKVEITNPSECLLAGHNWRDEICGANCFFEFDYDEDKCEQEATLLGEGSVHHAHDEESCRAAAEKAGYELGYEGYAFSGTYETKGCYTYSSGPFRGHAFWSEGDAFVSVGGDTEEVPYTACKLVVAKPDYRAAECAAGDTCAHAPFGAIRTRECPRDCVGEWVGECELTSGYTCNDLVDLYGESGWLNIHEVDGNRVCGETDNLQANHFVDPGMVKIAGDDEHSDIGASCRPMMTFPEALEVCECAGARLCTVAELENDVTKGTGCNFDVARVWSSSRSRAKGDGSGHIEMCPDRERWTAAGASEYASRFPSKCRDVTEQLAVRCCADHELLPVRQQFMKFQITTEASPNGQQCEFEPGDSRPLDCEMCGGEWSRECTIEDAGQCIEQTFDAAAALPAKFGEDLTHPSFYNLIETLGWSARLDKDPFCQCKQHEPWYAVTGDERTECCDDIVCPGHWEPPLECSICSYSNDVCAPEGSDEAGCPDWATCRSTALPDGDYPSYLSYGTMGLPDDPVSDGSCTITSIFVPDDPSSCPKAKLEETKTTQCFHPVDCKGHWIGTCADFQNTHDRGADAENPERTTPFQTFVVEQEARNIELGAKLCLYEGAEVEDGATIGLDCQFQNCEGHWEGECAECGEADDTAEKIQKELDKTKDCSFCNAFDPISLDWSMDQCFDAYAQLVSSESPCGFRLGLDQVPGFYPDDYKKCTDECSTLLAQFEGSCDLESLACVTIQKFNVTRPEILGQPCMSDDYKDPNSREVTGSYELKDGISTRLLHCAQDCKGEWSNPHADGVCEAASDYKARMENSRDAVTSLCGGVPTIPAADLQLTTEECQEIMDELNGVGDAEPPCGFKFSIDDVAEAVCTPECKTKISQISACAERDDIWAGAVQYEIYALAREACHGGSTETCSGSGETRKIQCASTECSYVPDYGRDWLESTTIACGRNPQKRDCQGGYRFPIDAQYTEWSPCVDGEQTRTCKTEAAFGGDNSACQKISNGGYKTETRSCGSPGGSLGSGQDTDVLARLAQLESTIAAYERTLSQPTVGTAPQSASPADAPGVAASQSQPELEPSAVPLAVAAGCAFGMVVVIGMAIVTRGRKKQPYKTLDEANSEKVSEDQVELAGVRASA